MKAFIAGIIVAVILIAAGVYFYFSTGSAPVATAAQAMPFEKMLANKALHARVEKEMPKTVPIAADNAAYAVGAQVYRENCAVCHGLPQQPKSAIAAGEFPAPPQLFQGKGVTDDPAGETYWKVANGIRMTGMPGFGNSLSTTQMWQVSLLLANADKLPSDVQQTLAAPLQAPPQSAPQAEPAPAAKRRGRRRG
ncbi:MAG TPA: c-type cytochrome [Terriglobales bacterium]|nr:c-type cytochrome [Terriglobales bacterium]